MILVLLLLLVVGCTPLRASYTEGRVTVELADPWATKRACVEKTGRAGAWGCHERTLVQTPDGPGVVDWHHTIRCPYADPEAMATCFAHEIRHALEPGWRHER